MQQILYLIASNPLSSGSSFVPAGSRRGCLKGQPHYIFLVCSVLSGFVNKFLKEKSIQNSFTALIHSKNIQQK